MKKKIMAIIAGLCAVALLGGCAGSGELSNDNITIKKYKGLEVEKSEDLTVTDEDVELSIQSDLEMLATKTDITDRAAQNGDISTIDYVGKKDGVEFEGGSATDYELELGSGMFIPGFEDGVVGHKIGETFDLNLTFPETYSNNPDLAGKAVVFTVTLKALQEKHVPELTDDILPELNTTAKTVEEYKAQVKKDLEKSNKETAEQSLVASLWDALVKQCEVKKYPDGMVEEYVTTLEEQYSYYAQMYGMEVDQFFEEVLQMSSKEAAELNVTRELAVALIAEKEGLSVSDKEYEKGLKELAEQYGYDDTKEFAEAYGEETIRDSLLQEKVSDLLLEHCVQVEPKEEKEDK